MNKEDKKLIRDTKKALHFLTSTDFDKLFADVNDDRPATEQELEHVFNVFINYFYKVHCHLSSTHSNKDGY